MPGTDATMPAGDAMAPAPTGGKRSAWMTHVKATMRAHKGKPLSAVLKMAKKTYKKTRRGGAGGVASTAAAVGGRRRRSGKGSRKH